MDHPAAKRARLTMEDVLTELDHDDDDGPMLAGSDDEFEDIVSTEKRRDEWGGMEDYELDVSIEPNPLFSPTNLFSLPTHLGEAPRSSGLPLPTPLGEVPGSSGLSLPTRLGEAPGSSGLPLPTRLGEAPGSSGLPLPTRLGEAPGSSGLPLPTPLGEAPGSSGLPLPTHLGEAHGSSGLPPLPTVSAGVGDLSLPLSSFFSRPVSELVTLLQSALTPTPSPSPTLTSVGTCPPQGPTVPTTRVSWQSLPARVHVLARRTPVAAPTASSGNWSRTLSPIDIAPFVQPVGPTVPIPQSPVEVFNLFFTDEICTLIVEQTNLYAEQNLGEDEWDKVTVEELRAYFGFKIMMGLVPLPAVDDYWQRDPLFHYAPIADWISGKRFREITRYLHFADNTHLPQPGEPGYDRLGKVRGIMGKVQERFTALYKPHCECAIDEAMIPFQGRSSLKQYMPAKPVKRGIKVWCLTDAHNRYMCETQVYEERAGSVECSLGKRVVLDLSEQLEGKSTTSMLTTFSPRYLSSPLCVTGVSMPVGRQGKIIETSPRPCG